MLQHRTNRNVFVKTFNCGVNVKTKDCAGSRPFQRKLQHHCFTSIYFFKTTLSYNKGGLQITSPLAGCPLKKRFTVALGTKDEMFLVNPRVYYIILRLTKKVSRFFLSKVMATGRGCVPGLCVIVFCLSA